jgi:hypothetical protein
VDAPTKHGIRGAADPAGRNFSPCPGPPSVWRSPAAGTLSTACEGTLIGWSVITPDPGTGYECRWTND